jgi:hypothetical protein
MGQINNFFEKKKNFQTEGFTDVVINLPAGRETICWHHLIIWGPTWSSKKTAGQLRTSNQGRAARSLETVSKWYLVLKSSTLSSTPQGFSHSAITNCATTQI